ncbi:hypothetical protein H0N98_03375 [Candidatus Micrarchaeota archaeon]|nr:hypothetical protein [Candidatus Micrarchaeota archaeon]
MARAQAAMEFVMTYGWMLLILVVVFAVLMTMGLLNPPKPVMCGLPATFTCKSMKLTTDSNLTLDLYQNTGHDITVAGVNCTKNPGSNPTLTGINVRINNSDHGLIANGIGIQCLDAAGNNATGRTGGHYTGKIIFYYIEDDTGMPHLVSGDINMNYE